MSVLTILALLAGFTVMWAVLAHMGGRGPQ